MIDFFINQDYKIITSNISSRASRSPIYQLERNILSQRNYLTNTHFVENLTYNLNGNIATQNWLQASKNRTYTFDYDKLSRLKSATYTNAAFPSEKFAENLTYDKMGNIITILREGLTATATYGTIDNLTFGYTGNQLNYITDAGPNVNLGTSADFKDYSKVTTAEYTFNKNGAMTKDLNKGISSVAYNSLNLPLTMDIKSPVAEARNEYTYTATGAKLKVVKKWNPNYSTTPVIGTTINTSSLTLSETTDYAGNKVYENGILKRILTDNGYIEGNTYYFYIKDHLGNNRIVANASASVIQSNQYYPFGMAFAEGTTTEQGKQPYKYNGKELDQSHGLNQYDYQARFYDPGYNRFTTQDPMSEKYYNISPYAYVANNPLIYVDPDGKAIGTIVGGIIGGIAGAIDAHNKGGDVWAGAAEGAVTGAVFDLLVGSAIATGGTSLIVTSAIVAGGAGSGLGTVIGDQVGQVVENVNKGMGVSDAVNNTNPTPTAKIKESVVVGVGSSLIGAGGGTFLNKAAQVATKEAQSTLSKNIVQTTKTLQTMNASQATTEQAIGKITTGMSQVGSNVNASTAVVGTAITTTIEGSVKLLQPSINEEQKRARLNSVIN